MTRHGSERTALRAMRVVGGVVLVLAVILVAVMPQQPVRANVPGFTTPVVGFELASTPEHVFGILGVPGDAEQAEARVDAVAAMDRGNRIDYLFMLAYPTFYVTVALLLVARGLAPRTLVTAMVVLAAVMAAGDALENRELLTLSQTLDPGAMSGPLGRLRLFTTVKWAAIFVASAVLAAYAWRDPSGLRWAGACFGLAALLGLASLVWLPGVEYGSYALALAWTGAWIHALRAR